MGTRRRGGPDDALPRPAPARLTDRDSRTQSLWRPPGDGGADDRLLAGGGERRDGDRPHAGGRNPAPDVQLRGVVDAVPADGDRAGDERVDAAVPVLRGTHATATTFPIALTSFALGWAPTSCSFTWPPWISSRVG